MPAVVSQCQMEPGCEAAHGVSIIGALRAMNQRIKQFNNGFDGKDALALIVIALLFAAMLIASWQRWTQPLLDHGREMNLPARIMAGEQLYRDVQYLYGPVPPVTNARLYHLFGIHLSVLTTSGAILALLILLLIYWLSRQLTGVWESALTTSLVLVICALKSTANYIQPYSYAALYGLFFSLVSLAYLVPYIRMRSAPGWLTEVPVKSPPPSKRGARELIYPGAFAGFALASKPELALAALGAGGTALFIECLSRRRWLWREILWFALPAIVVVIVSYAQTLSHVPLQVLLEDNHILFTNMPPQLVYFNRQISGLATWPRSAWFTLAGAGVFVMWIGVCIAVGALVSIRRHKEWRNELKTGAILFIIGVVWRETAVYIFHVPSDVTPFASAALVLLAIVVAIGFRIWKLKGSVPLRHRLLLVFSVFSFISILRVIFNVTTTGPYTPFFIPVLIIVYLYLLFHLAPALLVKNDSIRLNVQRAAMCLIGVLVIGMGINSTIRFRRFNTFTVTSPRGSFITSREIGEPLQAAIRYVDEHTEPDDYVLTLPVATTINFITARRYPLREEIVHPGFLDGEKEDRAIERLERLHPPLILIANLDTSEFRDRSFGLDYNRKLMDWIKRNYHITTRFDSSVRGDANFGREPFFILAYTANDPD